LWQRGFLPRAAGVLVQGNAFAAPCPLVTVAHLLTYADMAIAALTRPGPPMHVLPIVPA